ncbi:MAG: hypothetical protein ACP5UU_06080 [Thermoprotei archaeon]
MVERLNADGKLLKALSSPPERRAFLDLAEVGCEANGMPNKKASLISRLLPLIDVDSSSSSVAPIAEATQRAWAYDETACYARART